MNLKRKNAVATFLSLALLIVAFTPILLQIRVQVSGSTVSISQTYEWPMYRHDVSRSGCTVSPAPTERPTTIRWQVETGTSICSSPAVVEGKVYINAGCSSQRTVLCIDMDTGSVIWNQTVSGTMCSSPAVVGGKVYTVTLGGDVYCLDASTGQVLWNYAINTGDGSMVSSPSVVEGRLFVGCYCFDADTGELLWRYPTDSWLSWESSPAVVDGRVYIGGRDHYVTCLDANTGGLIWNYLTDGPVWSSPAVAEGRVYVGTREKGTVYCLDASTGTKVWSQNTVQSNSVMSSPAVAYGNVYVGTEKSGRLFCLDAYTGNIKWVNDTKGVIHHTSPAVTDGRVYVCASPTADPDSGGLYCFDAYTGYRQWRYNFALSGYHSSSAVVAYGMIFAAGDTSVFAFGAPIWPREPKTWVVDDDGTADFQRIQDAIDSVSSGDTILVRAGTYHENLSINSSLSLIGEDRNNTIIESDGNITEITACNVTITGFTIKGSGSSPNCNGISVASDGNVISNNSLENNSGRGIELVNSHDSVIAENEFTGNLQGIWLKNSDNNTICLNTIDRNGNGLEIEGSNFNNVSWNQVENSSECGMSLGHSVGNLLQHNDVSASRIMGLRLCDSGGNVLRENRLSGNQYNFEITSDSEVQGFLNDVDASNTVDGAPIRCVMNQRQLLIDGSVDSNIGYLALINCENITVTNLQLKRNGEGVLIVNSTYIRAENITVSNNIEGIHMCCTNESTLLKNTIIGNEDGVIIDTLSYRNLVAENNMSDNARGIALRHSCNNEVSQNYISGNGEALSICSSSENRVCENNFQNNVKQLEDSNSDGTIWNSESPRMGNYWSELNFADEDKDKIADHPYSIDENNTDPYPLIYPYEFYNPNYVPRTDMNKDGVVNIVDIAKVARAFACKPGDPRWIPTADMDRNEIIDIVDLSRVAKDSLSFALTTSLMTNRSK
jgi:parallel beta-helix repeat protein